MDNRRSSNELEAAPQSAEITQQQQIVPALGGGQLHSIDGRVLPSNGTFIYHANQVVLMQAPVEGKLSAEEIQQRVDGFTLDVNERTAQQSASNIAGEFDGQIQEPETEVAPVLLKTNFFRGETALDEVDYTLPDEGRRKKKKKKAREVEVHLENLHKHGRYIILVGGAGSGKTTLIKRYCVMVLQKKIMKDVLIVHLINVRDLSKEELTPKEMLFGKFLVGEHKKENVKYGYEWMQKEENQPKVLIAFDGMDTAPWMLSDDNHDLITYDDKRPAATIIYNILHGHLFPKCPILLASREYGITKFPRAIRPDSVIALKGFTRDSIMILVKELGGDKGNDIWEALQRKSVNLMLLCSTPLFLIFTIIVYKKYENPPENLSGIIITIIDGHIHSEHSLVKDVMAILEKLKALSLQGLLEGRVVFTMQEFKDHGLNVEDVKDLVINVPTPNKDAVCNQKLLEEDYSYFFCHQAFQESLAALCVAGMEMDEFEDFVKARVHQAKYIIVRQILCGVLYNDETTTLATKHAKVTHKEGKRILLLSTLRDELKRILGNGNQESATDLLNMLISLRECGGQPHVVQMIKETLPKISLSHIALTPSDLHAAASVASHCDKLSIMQLVNCHLDGHSLEVLAKGMEKSNVEITVFDVSFNTNLRKDSMYYLHEICIRGQGLNYWQCGFRQKDILAFNERESERETTEASDPSDEDVIERNFKDNVLDLSSYNVENHLELLKKMIKRSVQNGPNRVNVVDYVATNDVSPLCTLVKDCKNLAEFAISESELTEDQLKRMKLAIGDKKLDTLNVFLNPDIQENGWKVLGDMAKCSFTKNLYITACSLTEVKLKGFKFSLKGTKIFKFDVSRNDNMDQKCLGQIGEIVDICKVEELVMGYCNFKSEHMKHLKHSVSRGRINRIDVSGNDSMGPEGYYALGEIVYKCNVKLLDVSECDPSAEEVAQFKDATHTAKITKLNVSRNRRMGVEGLRNVGEMVGKNCLDELFIRQCELEEHTLRSFHEGLGEAKIRHLDLGFYFMKVRPTTDAELAILMDILSHVTEQLTINDWDISEKGRIMLQEKIDSLPFMGNGLTIMFNRGKDDFIRQASS